MKTLKHLKSCQYEVTEGDEKQMTLHVQGRMDSTNAATMIRVLNTLLQKHNPASLIVDMGEVTYLDDFGVLVLLDLKEFMAGAGGKVQLINATDTVRGLLSIHDYDVIMSYAHYN